MTFDIIRGNALALPLEDASVDLVVTSPPYFGLRSYQDGGEHYDGQLGSEATPAEFLDALLAATREMVRVLKPSGSIFVNLGDKYGQSASQWQGSRRGHRGILAGTKADAASKWGAGAWDDAPAMGRPKSLLGIPWRYALRCIDDLGLILRAEIIWSKPNGLPESVTDRVRRSHEQWFHFTVRPRYYAAGDEIRESTVRRERPWELRGEWSDGAKRRTAAGASPVEADGQPISFHPLGKLPGSVWTVPETGESLVRSVLRAVSEGALTLDEGERILAWTPHGSWLTQSRQENASSGPATGTVGATPRSQSATGGRNSSTGSATSCSSDPSQTGSPSTTSAGTHPASDPTTSSPSLGERTSGEPTPSGPSADTDIASPTPTSRSPRQGSPTSGAGNASARSSESFGSSVWNVPTQPLVVPPELGIDHFAAFPMEFPRRIIRGWSPSGVCTRCGEGRRPVAERTAPTDLGPRIAERNGQRQGTGPSGNGLNVSPTTITGYTCACPILCANCKGVIHRSGIQWVHENMTVTCPRSISQYGNAEASSPAPTTPAVVLDPFGGTGTTALVAHAHGRHGISVDLSADYCRLAEWRCNDRAQLAAAMQVDKPEPVPDDQLEMFGGDVA